jgi:hypothetical protein
MREVVAPLREQHREIGAQIEIKTAELVELRAARTQLESVLRKLDPATFKPDGRSKNGSNGAQAHAAKMLERKTATLRTLIAERPELFADGVTANALSDLWKEEDLQPPVSIATLRQAFDQLRDEGIMRADKVVKGGGMSWKLVTNNGGTSDGT